MSRILKQSGAILTIFVLCCACSKSGPIEGMKNGLFVFQLPEGKQAGLRASADGRRLFFIQDSCETAVTRWDLMGLDIVTKECRVLKPNLMIRPLMADDTRILYTADSGGYTCLFQENLTTGETRPLSPPGRTVTDFVVDRASGAIFFALSTRLSTGRGSDRVPNSYQIPRERRTGREWTQLNYVYRLAQPGDTPHEIGAAARLFDMAENGTCLIISQNTESGVHLATISVSGETPAFLAFFSTLSYAVSHGDWILCREPGRRKHIIALHVLTRDSRELSGATDSDILIPDGPLVFLNRADGFRNTLYRVDTDLSLSPLVSLAGVQFNDVVSLPDNVLAATVIQDADSNGKFDYGKDETDLLLLASGPDQSLQIDSRHCPRRFVAIESRLRQLADEFGIAGARMRFTSGGRVVQYELPGRDPGDSPAARNLVRELQKRVTALCEDTRIGVCVLYRESNYRGQSLRDFSAARFFTYVGYWDAMLQDKAEYQIAVYPKTTSVTDVWTPWVKSITFSGTAVNLSDQPIDLGLEIRVYYFLRLRPEQVKSIKRFRLARDLLPGRQASFRSNLGALDWTENFTFGFLGSDSQPLPFFNLYSHEEQTCWAETLNRVQAKTGLALYDPDAEYRYCSRAYPTFAAPSDYARWDTARQRETARTAWQEVRNHNQRFNKDSVNYVTLNLYSEFDDQRWEYDRRGLKPMGAS